MGDKARQYPQTLVSVAKLAFKRPALSLRLISVVESKSALAGRIKHILNRPIPKTAKLGVLSFLTIFITAMILLPMAKAGKPVVLRVAVEGGAVYRSIQEAIDAAGAGAVIRIAPGVYREHLKINKPLTLMGSSWKQTTVITAGAGADVVEQAKRTLQVRMQEAETDDQRNKIAEKFKAEFKEKYGRPTLLVSDTEGVVIRSLKFTSPSRRLEGGMIPIPILEFNNAKAFVSRCTVIGAPGDGIHILNGSDVEIRSSLVAAVWGTGVIVGEKQGPTSRLRLLDRGGNIKHDEPTYINGTAWKPEWKARISRPYRLKQTIPLRESSNLIKLTKIAGKGSVTIAGKPQQANDYTLSILLDDSRNNGAQWYEFLIQWGPRDSQSSQKQVPSPMSLGEPISTAKNDLQQMIDSTQPGGIVVIPKAVYTQPVTVTKPLTLKGQSGKDCIFEVTANEPAIFVDTKGKGEVITELLQN